MPRPGMMKREPFAPAQAVVAGLLLHAFRDLRLRRRVRLVDALQHHHLRAEHLGVGGLAAGQARVPGQRRIAGGIDEAGGLHGHVAVAGGEMQPRDAPPLHLHVAQHRAHQRDDARLLDRPLHPAAERDLVVVDHGGDGAVAVVEGLVLLLQVVQDLVGDAVGELVAVRAVGEQAAEGGDDGVDGLASQRRQPVDDGGAPAEARGLQRRRRAGNAGADHADVHAHLARRAARGPLDNTGGGCRSGLVRQAGLPRLNAPRTLADAPRNNKESAARLALRHRCRLYACSRASQFQC